MRVFLQDKGNVKLLLTEIVKTFGNLEPTLKQWHTEMIPRVDRTFDLAGGAGSGMVGGYDPFREIRWAPFSPQYTRKGGDVIPAWGGVPQKRNPNKEVKGRLRPSGKRIDESSRLNQDTGRFRQRAITGFVKIDETSIVYGPNLNYAEYLEELRPTISIVEDDAELFEDILLHNALGQKRTKK